MHFPKIHSFKRVYFVTVYFYTRFEVKERQWRVCVQKSDITVNRLAWIFPAFSLTATFESSKRRSVFRFYFVFYCGACERVLFWLLPNTHSTVSIVRFYHEIFYFLSSFLVFLHLCVVNIRNNNQLHNNKSKKKKKPISIPTKTKCKKRKRRRIFPWKAN